jgi:hypothetical protein
VGPGGKTPYGKREDAKAARTSFNYLRVGIIPPQMGGDFNVRIAHIEKHGQVCLAR